LGLILLVLAATRIYDFSSGQAWATVHSDSRHYLDLVTRLPRGWALVIGLAALLGAAAGFGHWVVRLICRAPMRAGEAVLLATAAGLVVLSYAFLALGWLQLLRGPVIAAVIGVGLALGVPAALGFARRLRSRPPARPATAIIALSAGLGAALYVSLISALGPEVAFDARWYHLGVPVHFALHGGFYDIVRETHLTVAGLTPYQEILYSGLTSLFGMIGAKLLHWADAGLAALALVLVGKEHLGSARAGLLAGIVFITTPQVAWSAATGSNDLPLPLLSILVIHCVMRWRQDPGRRGWLSLAGLLGGYSIGVKPFGVFVLVFAALVVLG
jgi:hypothetical protein